jgi:hypothetical protein
VQRINLAPALTALLGEHAASAEQLGPEGGIEIGLACDLPLDIA